ncbi:hypothetical protein J6590_078506, partial [Homalodisca vitripennis]
MYIAVYHTSLFKVCNNLDFGVYNNYRFTVFNRNIISLYKRNAEITNVRGVVWGTGSQKNGYERVTKQKKRDIKGIPLAESEKGQGCRRIQKQRDSGQEHPEDPVTDFSLEV